jgi:malonyl-CoA O-methyltransferase
MTILDAREAYRLWAPTYAAETAISFLDEVLARALLPPLAGKRLLDAGCGTGRRIAGAAGAVGVDASLDMLNAGGARAVAAADVSALPFPPASFDMVWCRLVLGHLRDPEPAYREFAHVCRPGGLLFVTDFHADAAAAGHRRSFRDASGALHEVEHHVHDAAAHIAFAERAGFTFLARQDGTIGPAVKPFYACAGRLGAYERDFGLAVVAAFLFCRAGQCAS